MSDATAVDRYAPAAGVRRVPIARVQNALLWLTGAVSSFLFIEPSPYEIVSLLTMLVFAATGLTLKAALAPLILLLALINVAFTISSAELLGARQPILMWVMTSWYLAITCIFFAAMLPVNTEQRLSALMRGYLFAALIASLAAILGYFRLLPGATDLLLLFDRARGTFKDPNVLGAFLVLPALLAMQGVIAGRSWQMVRAGLLLLVFGAAMFLSFSRGAWGQLVFAAAMTLMLMFLTTGSPRQRARIVTAALGILAAGAVLLIALLSLDVVADLFEQRASLSQSYDVGEQGRFGRHILGAIMALDFPFGIGPLQFSKYFPEDPHNSYLNAFMSGGWLAGVAYFALVLLTAVYGFRHVFVAAPWRQTYIAVYAAFVGAALESAIIDTDHWRHYFLLLGVVWGLMAASRAYAASMRGASAPPDGAGLAPSGRAA